MLPLPKSFKLSAALNRPENAHDYAVTVTVRNEFAALLWRGELYNAQYRRCLQQRDSWGRAPFAALPLFVRQAVPGQGLSSRVFVAHVTGF